MTKKEIIAEIQKKEALFLLEMKQTEINFGEDQLLKDRQNLIDKTKPNGKRKGCIVKRTCRNSQDLALNAIGKVCRA